jgi:uncharacterized RDD family membrane protein YckC
MSGRLDTIHTVETPEGVELALRCAGPIPRGFAWVIDFVLRGIAMLLVGWALSTLGQASMGIILVVAFFTEWLYPVFFEVLWHGRTPGKRVFGLAVIRDDGLPVDWGSSFLRNLLRVADFLPGMFGAALISMMASRSFKRLGDLAAGTIVVYSASEAVLPWQFETKSNVLAHAPVVALTLEEQRSVIAFAARARLLGKARADELASVAAHALDGRTHASASPTERVIAVASWLRESGHTSGDAGEADESA